ncbi:ANTAR domain-containing response regulator [Clostridium akagii]|uniref:ANTAR domain-containing response regulator n=1 Tax=Clostridium akagii TaxID=91623 RepID=UPI00047DCB9D|nr:response regulator [Clostridium akagii]
MKYKIIVAEDEPITRMDICEMLVSAGYYVVGQASNGLQAVELCRKCKPDLVLMDIKMPKLDGIQAAELLLEENIVEAIVMLTAYSGKEFIDKVKEIGAIGYIVKPIDERSLIPQIEIAIAKGKEIKLMREKIENITTIYAAKEILMEKYKLTENDAYKRLRKLSMDKQSSILETSKNIIGSISGRKLC